MLKTKIISVWDYDHDLASKINKWIEANHEDLDIKDIKYSQVYVDRSNRIQYSAMILYVRKSN